MLDLDNLRDRLDNMLDKETADSLNEWLNNKRDVMDEQVAMVQLVGVLDDIQSIMHELASGELNELIDELTHVYERYSIYANARNGDQH
jgi:hypothetical protein